MPNVEHWSEVMTKFAKLVVAGIAVTILSVGFAISKRSIKEHTPIPTSPILTSMPEIEIGSSWW
jgi:hypothetical protein